MQISNNNEFAPLLIPWVPGVIIVSYYKYNNFVVTIKKIVTD